MPAKKKFIAIEYNKKLAKPYINSDVIILLKTTELNDMRPKWSMELDKQIGAGHSVTFPMFQLAVYMGFEKIYFLGQDCSYMATIENGNNGNNHFYKGSNDVITQRDANNFVYAFYSIKDFAEEKNIQVFNATRGGNLELFERVTLEDILGC